MSRDFIFNIEFFPTCFVFTKDNRRASEAIFSIRFIPTSSLFSSTREFIRSIVASIAFFFHVGTESGDLNQLAVFVQPFAGVPGAGWAKRTGVSGWRWARTPRFRRVLIEGFVFCFADAGFRWMPGCLPCFWMTGTLCVLAVVTPFGQIEGIALLVFPVAEVEAFGWAGGAVHRGATPGALHAHQVVADNMLLDAFL